MFLGRSVTQHKQVSDGTAHAIDEEVRRVIESNYERATAASSTTNLDKLHTMAEALIKYETIDEEQLKDIMAGQHAQAAGGLGRHALEQAADGARGRPPRPAVRRSRRASTERHARARRGA